MAIYGNREKCFKKTPERFSADSRVTGISTGDIRSGLILDSIDEVKEILETYENNGIMGSGHAKNVLMDELGNAGGGLGAAVIELGSQMNSCGFLDAMLHDVESSLQSCGRYYGSFDYDALGTRFFKSTVEAYKAWEKYVLCIRAAYVGDEPEKLLAEKTGKRRALVRSVADAEMELVDGYWFNIDMGELMGSLLEKEQIRKLVAYLEADRMTTRPEMIIEHDGSAFELGVSIKAPTWLRPENGCFDDRYFRARGNCLVGASWKKDKNTPQGIAAVHPYVEVSLYPVAKTENSECYSMVPSLTIESDAKVQAARNHVVELMKQ